MATLQKVEIALADVCSESKEWGLAVSHLQSALITCEDTERCFVFWKLGVCFENLGDHSTAAENFRRAIGHNNHDWLFIGKQELRHETVKCSHGDRAALLYYEFAKCRRKTGFMVDAMNASMAAVHYAMLHSDDRLLGTVMYHIVCMLTQFRGGEEEAKKWVEHASELLPCPELAETYEWASVALRGDAERGRECAFRALWCSIRDGATGAPEIPVSDGRMCFDGQVEVVCKRLRARYEEVKQGCAPVFKRAVGVIGDHTSYKVHLMNRLLGTRDEREWPFCVLDDGRRQCITVAEYTDSPVTTIKIEFLITRAELTEMLCLPYRENESEEVHNHRARVLQGIWAGTLPVGMSESTTLDDLVGADVVDGLNRMSMVYNYSNSASIAGVVMAAKSDPMWFMMKKITVSSRAFVGLGKGTQLMDIPVVAYCAHEHEAIQECEKVVSTQQADAYPEYPRTVGYCTPFPPAAFQANVFDTRNDPGFEDCNKEGKLDMRMSVNYCGLRVFLGLPF